MNPAINVHNGAKKPDQTKTQGRKKNLHEEEPTPHLKKRSNGLWTFLKVTLIILVAGTVLLVGSFFIMGKAVIEAVDESANQKVIQTVDVMNGQVLIHVPLKKDLGMVIYGYKKCFHFEGGFNEPSNSSFCSNGNCKITVTFEDTLPKDVSLYVERGNDCALQKFPVGDKAEVVGYSAKLEMTPELLEKLHVTEDRYNVSSINARGTSSYQIMGTKKVTLDYGQHIPDSDTLTINNESKATILFN